MTLTRLLEINSRLIRPSEASSLGLADRIWREYGCPTGVRELTDILEKVLSECCQDGIRYAPILLQRKKALHRGTWMPSAESTVPPSGGTQAASYGDRCPKCGDSGVMAVRGGRGGTLCPCDAWKKKVARPA